MQFKSRGDERLATFSPGDRSSGKKHQSPLKKSYFDEDMADEGAIADEEESKEPAPPKAIFRMSPMKQASPPRGEQRSV